MNKLEQFAAKTAVIGIVVWCVVLYYWADHCERELANRTANYKLRDLTEIAGPRQ